MDIYRFINSKDIREHLSDIGYEFNPFECAYLVWLSNRTIKEKHNAFCEIIETMPDMPLPEHMFLFADKAYTLHTYLEKYMEIENRLLDKFMQPDNIYQYSVMWGSEWRFSDEYFGSFEDCISDCKESYEDDEISSVRIRKTRPRKNDEKYAPDLIVRYKIDEGITEIKQSRILDESDDVLFDLFEEVWLEFPTPFEKGDILCGPTDFDIPTNETLFVITELCTWESEERKAKWKKNHNCWGMTAHGYHLDDDGHVACDEMMFNYLNLELYRGELKGRQRFMKALSNFVKSEMDIALLLRAYDIIMKEADVSEWANIYTDEGLELAGLK